jgi:hypothetical protein
MSAKELFESIKEALPGLQNIGTDLKNEASQQMAHGAHELAAALFNGSGFVMYPRQSARDDIAPEHGVHGPDIKAPETPQMDNGNDMDRGGRSR